MLRKLLRVVVNLSDVPANAYDPNALYHEEADRFILGIDGTSTSIT